MRTILALFCVVMGSGIGLYQSMGLKRRAFLLSEIIGLLEGMAVQIRYRALPLGDLFISLNGGEFLQKVRGSSHKNYREAWNNAADSFSELDQGDREIIISIGNSLGNSDITGQVAMLELNKELLTKRLANASEAFARKGAMYRSVGLLAGLGFAIMVI